MASFSLSDIALAAAVSSETSFKTLLASATDVKERAQVKARVIATAVKAEMLAKTTYSWTTDAGTTITVSDISYDSKTNTLKIGTVKAATKAKKTVTLNTPYLYRNPPVHTFSSIDDAGTVTLSYNPIETFKQIVTRTVQAQGG